MELVKYRVNNFRSVQSTNWIEINDWACFVGLNESGKSSLLLALSKFNPLLENDDINYILDYPKNKYDSQNETAKDDFFVDVLFKLTNDEKQELNMFSEYIVDEIGNEIEQVEDGYEKEEAQRIFAENAELAKKGFTDYLLLSKNYNRHYTIATSNSQADKILTASERFLDEFFNKMWHMIPTFIYKSNYEGLDSDMDLSEIIPLFNETETNLEENRTKVKTLKSLFEFLKLEHNQILELVITKENRTQKVRNTIKLRNIMKKASKKLSKEFNDWWKNDNYNFELFVDRDNFRIYVSDDKHPEEIELEYRGTGLIWCLSFFLNFSLGGSGIKENCILLLDEPGLNLHPIAQKSLIELFQSLSKKNKLIYTTHLPFLIDSNRLENTYVVHTNNDGFTEISNDLQVSSKQNSVQSVYAAIGMSIAESLFMNGNLVVVEGESDQFYLRMIQQYLDSIGDFEIENLFFFIPAGGASNIKHIVSIILGSEEGSRPYILFDSDSLGKKCKKSLIEKLYSNDQEKILEINDILNKKNAEIEDIIPNDWIIVAFKDYIKAHYQIGIPKDKITIGKGSITTELENFASEKHKINLKDNKSWKTEIAKIVKKNFDSNKVDENYKKMWIKLFDALQGNNPKTKP